MISPGKIARKIFGPKLFFIMAYHYREFFLNTKNLINCLPEIPAGSTILDIGGGDGALLNTLFDRFPDISISMVDTAEQIGQAVESQYKNKVALYPQTMIQSYAEPAHDYIFVFDVLHHVKMNERDDFLDALMSLVTSGSVLIIKDVEPKGLKAFLGWWADRYISGDPHVHQISEQSVRDYIALSKPEFVVTSLDVYKNDAPNYCLTVTDPSSIF